MKYQYKLELEKSEAAFMVIGSLMRYMHLFGREGTNIISPPIPKAGEEVTIDVNNGENTHLSLSYEAPYARKGKDGKPILYEGKTSIIGRSRNFTLISDRTIEWFIGDNPNLRKGKLKLLDTIVD